MKMNKKVLITVSSVVIASVLGLGIYQSNAAQAEPKLNIDEIKELVTAQYPGTITEIDIDKGFNKVIYEVEVENEGTKYEVELDGDTGEILKLEEKKTRKAKQNPTDLAIKEKEQEKSNETNEKEKTKDESTTTDDSKKDQATNNNDNSNTSNNSNNNSKRVVISYEEAKKIALAEFDGTIEELELDEDDDRYIYEIEIKSSTGEAEMDIDAYTGEIISISIDSEITKPQNNTNNEKPTTNKPSTNKPVNDDDRYDDDDDGDEDDDNDDD